MIEFEKILKLSYNIIIYEEDIDILSKYLDKLTNKLTSKDDYINVLKDEKVKKLIINNNENGEIDFNKNFI